MIVPADIDKATAKLDKLATKSEKIDGVLVRYIAFSNSDLEMLGFRLNPKAELSIVIYDFAVTLESKPVVKTFSIRFHEAGEDLKWSKLNQPVKIVVPTVKK